MAESPINILTKEIKNLELPDTVINHIQKYLKNDIVYEAINKYYGYLYDKKKLYEEFVWNNYVFPKCYCNGCPDNGRNKLFRRKDCDYCFIFQFTSKYKLTDFEICIENNPQFFKIIGYPDHEEIEYDEDYFDESNKIYSESDDDSYY